MYKDECEVIVEDRLRGLLVTFADAPLECCALSLQSFGDHPLIVAHLGQPWELASQRFLHPRQPVPTKSEARVEMMSCGGPSKTTSY